MKQFLLLFVHLIFCCYHNCFSYSCHSGMLLFIVCTFCLFCCRCWQKCMGHNAYDLCRGLSVVYH